MKNLLKIICLITSCLLLTGCNDDEIDHLEYQIENLEQKIDALLDKNNIYIPSTDNEQNNTGTNNITNNGEGTTTIDTSTITSTIEDFQKKAKNINQSISSLTIPSKRSETIDLYFEWKYKIEDLENQLDRYEDSLERMYRSNELSYTDYRNFDRQVENIENILDRAEDELEFQTNYDD